MVLEPSGGGRGLRTWGGTKIDGTSLHLTTRGMGQERPTEPMEQLLERLREAIDSLAVGRLGEAALNSAAEDARSLYERLVVLRHKVRERAAAPPVPEPAPSPVELPPMRLDTRPAEAPVRQTSLIDAIAETEATTPAPPPSPMPVPEAPTDAGRQPVPKAPAPSLSERLEQAPVKDLHKAIALSQKFWFVAELFDGQRERYEKAIDALNACRSAADAHKYLEVEVLAKVRRTPDPDAVKALQELIDRRPT